MGVWKKPGDWMGDILGFPCLTYLEQNFSLGRRKLEVRAMGMHREMDGREGTGVQNRPDFLVV